MKAYQVNFFNGLVLCGMGLWAYTSSENPSFTALIPVLFGLLFLGLTKPLRKENKVIAHVVVALTLLILIALIKPLVSVVGRSEVTGTFRVVVMMLVSLFALIIYIINFLNARKVKAGSKIN
jgi:uncharacterized membrane protein